MVCKNHIFPLSYVMIFIAFLVQVWRQRRGGGGGFLKYWFLLTGGLVWGSKKAQNTLTSYLNSPLPVRQVLDMDFNNYNSWKQLPWECNAESALKLCYGNGAEFFWNLALKFVRYALFRFNLLKFRKRQIDGIFFISNFHTGHHKAWTGLATIYAGFKTEVTC